MSGAVQQNRNLVAAGIGLALMLAMSFVLIPAFAAGSHSMPPWNNATKNTGGGGTASWTLSSGSIFAKAPSPTSGTLSWANIWMTAPSEFLSAGTIYAYNIQSGHVEGKLTVTNSGTGKYARIIIQGWIADPSCGDPKNCALGGTKMTLYSKTITSGTFDVDVDIQNLSGIQKTLPSSGLYFSVFFVSVEASGTGNSADFSSTGYGITNVHGSDTWV